jgi:hypothetical protein
MTTSFSFSGFEGASIFENGRNKFLDTAKEAGARRLVSMTAVGQYRRFRERCANDRFLIRKRPLRVAPTNGRLWPISAVGGE